MPATHSRPLLATPAELAAIDAGKARNDLVDSALHTAGLLRSTHDDDAIVGESLVLLVSAAETYVAARRHLTALIAEENA